MQSCAYPDLLIGNTSCGILIFALTRLFEAVLTTIMCISWTPQFLIVVRISLELTSTEAREYS